jgi:hypothetical protein
MGYFFFWPTTVYQQLRFHFDILRFYQDFTFLIFAAGSSSWGITSNGLVGLI